MRAHIHFVEWGSYRKQGFPRYSFADLYCIEYRFLPDCVCQNAVLNDFP
jgi:hypothetical protein